MSLTIRFLGTAALFPALCGCTAAGAEVFVEDFDDDTIDPNLWWVDLYGAGVQLTEVNHQLEFGFAADAHGSEYGARLLSLFQLRGDFDVQVDYSLPQWPNGNGVRMAIGLTDAYYDDYGVERSSLPDLGISEAYVADFGPFIIIPTDDFTGKLRLVRSGATQTGYYWAAGWIPILTDSAPTGDTTIQLHAWSHDYAFGDRSVIGALDNFAVVSGEVIGLPVPTRTTTWGSVRGLYRWTGR